MKGYAEQVPRWRVPEVGMERKAKTAAIASYREDVEGVANGMPLPAQRARTCQRSLNARMMLTMLPGFVRLCITEDYLRMHTSSCQ